MESASPSATSAYLYKTISNNKHSRKSNIHGLIWLSLRSGGNILSVNQSIFGCHRQPSISESAGRLPATSGGLCSIELVLDCSISSQPFKTAVRGYCGGGDIIDTKSSTHLYKYCHMLKIQHMTLAWNIFIYLKALTSLLVISCPYFFSCEHTEGIHP